MGRAPCCEKVGLRRGRWTAEEDETLINYIKQNGEGSWRSLPKNAGILACKNIYDMLCYDSLSRLLRCGKSCRLRWINYLRADLKRGNFTREEEETIIKLHRSLGNKWSLIASNLPGRTDNEVKNYWNSHLSRKIYSFKSSTGSMVTTLDMVKMASTCKRKGGRVSRAVAKKYNTNPISKTSTTTSSSSTKPKIGEISGTKEATTAENAGVGLSETRSEMHEFRAAENAQVYDRGLGSVEECGKYHLKPVDIYDEVERESVNCIHEHMCDGLKRCPDILTPSPEKLEGENEVLGPNDVPDDVTLLIERFMESESTDLSEISVHSRMTQNESVDPESALSNKESDCGGTGSNLNSDTAHLYQCFSPLNSCFNHELITWETECAVPGFELWDQADDMLWLQ